MIFGARSVRSTIVDSTPLSTVPPSKSASKPCKDDDIISEGFVAGFSPDLFALVPTRYLQCLSNERIHLLLGILTPMLILPEVTLVDIFSSMIGDIIVRAPGQ